jgi:hypothetical protein
VGNLMDFFVLFFWLFLPLIWLGKAYLFFRSFLFQNFLLCN